VSHSGNIIRGIYAPFFEEVKLVIPTGNLGKSTQLIYQALFLSSIHLEGKACMYHSWHSHTLHISKSGSSKIESTQAGNMILLPFYHSNSANSLPNVRTNDCTQPQPSLLLRSFTPRLFTHTNRRGNIRVSQPRTQTSENFFFQTKILFLFLFCFCLQYSHQANPLCCWDSIIIHYFTHKLLSKNHNY
jgi:hypothetical protein